MKRIKHVIRSYAPWVAAALLLAGCASEPLDGNALTAAPIETRTPLAAGSVGSGGATTSAAPQSSVTTVDLSKQNAASGSAAMIGADQRVIYFDFDSYAIKDEYKDVIDRNARSLASQSGKRMTVEGYTDDRGGREYNLALGQKRAESVVKAMELLGVAERQLEAVSFGEERPVASGADEAAYAKNRRAELKDR
ncbi:MAG: peptidoglycan-associated lipoprotein Pal [Pseudomonadota bacterium]|nr:peptidoglycan-associated lipoprotein Pal [Pseudomonadota bacterium]